MGRLLRLSSTTQPWIGRLCVLACALALTSCLSAKDEKDPKTGNGSDPSNSPNYQGCTSGTALDTSRVQLTFTYPANADLVTIFRDGVEIAAFETQQTTFTDTGLNEGQTYNYTCKVVIGGVPSPAKPPLAVTTLLSNPPVFAGINTANALTSSSVQVTWLSASKSGTAASFYQIFANVGTTVNWTLLPRKTVNVGALSTTLTGLGDELPYAFGVRACATASICESNTVGKTVTLADGGAPQTIGVTNATAANGQMTLTAPWTDSNGGIKKRYVFQRIGPVGGTTISNYTLVQTNVVSDVTNPPVSLVIPGISDSTTYHYIVQDEDPTGHNNNNLNVFDVTTGDTTPPVFGGINSLALGAPVDKSFVINFTAINREGIEPPGGASFYLIYLTSALFPGSGGNPCTAGTLYGSPISAAGYPPGAASVTLTGLNPRTTYSVCMRAKDAAGNISTNIDNQSITTLDVTAPQFDGIQSLLFNSGTSNLDMTWNQSPSSDVANYRIKIWKNTATPAAGQITTINKSASGSPTGTTITQAQFTFGNLDTVYAIVDACDDANTLPGGSQNCTAYALSTARSVTLPNFMPPQGFTGIKGPGSQISTVEGQLTVAWYAPTSWTPDYTGFKVYQVNPTTNAIMGLLKTCACVTPGACATVTDTSCTITGLNPGRTYRLHVRAFNAGNFETTYLDPAVSYADKKVADTTNPTFSSGLAVGAVPTYSLTWSAASDNQYTGDGAVINYKVYRKAASNFATPTNPSADGVLAGSTPTLAFNDSGWADGQTYYYSVCAVDSSSNSTCDGVVKSFTVADTTPPLVVGLTTTKTTTAKKWDLTWSLADNTTASNMIGVKVYQKACVTSPCTATTADTLLLDSVGDTSLTALTGPINQDRYISYLVQARDLAGNVGSSAIQIFSQNTVTVTSVARNSGPTAGGATIVVRGTGFSNGANNAFGTNTLIKLGSVNCTGIQYVNSTMMVCKTPGQAQAPVDVVAQNPDGSSATLLGAYQYLNASPAVCDNPGSWGELANSNTAAGTSADPFIICTAAQLNMLHNVTPTSTKNYRTGGYYFQLGDNIDFTSVSFAPLGGNGGTGTVFAGTIDGNGMAITNWTFSAPAADYVGFVGYNTGSITLKNLSLLNATVTGRDYTGIALGAGLTSTVTISNVITTGVVNGRTYVGGIVGNINWSSNCCSTPGSATFTNSSSSATVNATANYSGGLLGIFYNSNALTISNSYATGNVTGGSYVGGLGGALSGGVTITDSYATGNVTTIVNSSSGIGGLLGSLYAPGATAGQPFNVTRSYATGNVSGAGNYMGGFVGSVGAGSDGEGIISSSYATGNVMGDTGLSGSVGGFTGGNGYRTGITISDCYARGNPQGNNNVGGFVGLIYDTWGAGHVATYSRNYSTGVVTGGAGSGGFIGSFRNYGNCGVNSNLSSLTANFFNKSTSGFTADQVSSTCVAPNQQFNDNKARTTAQMQDQVTNLFTGAGWDFTAGTGVWKWPAGTGYPVLQWQP